MKLHIFGLLRNSFRPDEEIVVMRTYWRQKYRQQQINMLTRKAAELGLQLVRTA